MIASKVLLADLCYSIFGTFYSENDLQSNSAFAFMMNMAPLETISLKMGIWNFFEDKDISLLCVFFETLVYYFNTLVLLCFN